MKRALWAALCLLAFTGVAVAQTVRTPAPMVMFEHGSTIDLFTGAATAASTTGAIAGGGVGWELTPRFTIEGSGQWLEWSSSQHGFSAALAAEAGLSGSRALMPFVTAGAGLYHVDFDRPDLGMPAFYARRVIDRSSAGTVAHFTDPTLIVAGGVNTFVSRHWAIRPEVRETTALRDARSYWMTTFAFHVAYHFEDHPITPRAR
jgi:hypothetical protein